MSGNIYRFILDTLCRLFFHGGYDGAFSKQSVPIMEPGEALPPQNKGGIARLLPAGIRESNQRVSPRRADTKNAKDSGHSFDNGEGVQTV